MSDATNRPGRSLLQLAATLRLAAQRLADDASGLEPHAEPTPEQLDRLEALRRRTRELLAACHHLTGVASPDAQAQQLPPLPPAALVELASWREYDKFRRLRPITEADIAACDVDELIRRLHEEQA
jgi:hypothetical protein